MRDHFEVGDFSVLIYDRVPATINIVAIDTVARGEVIVSATTRGKPTRKHVAAAEAYKRWIRPYIGTPRPASN